MLLSDTVGFIQKLPTQLVAAFRATLEEIKEAQLLVHVVDVSHPNAAAQSEAVMQVPVSALVHLTCWVVPPISTRGMLPLIHEVTTEIPPLHIPLQTLASLIDLVRMQIVKAGNLPR